MSVAHTRTGNDSFWESNAATARRRNSTQLVHGPDGLRTAQQATAAFFGAAIDNLTDEALTEIFADVPSHRFSFETLSGEGLLLVEVMTATKLATSRSVARRTIEQGGAYINNVRVSDSAISHHHYRFGRKNSSHITIWKEIICPCTIRMKISSCGSIKKIRQSIETHAHKRSLS